jgi:hypothetical protein
MFRTKVAIALFGVFAVITGVLYLRVDDQVETAARNGVEKELRLSLGTLDVMRRLQDYAIVAKASEVAAWPQIAEILTRPRESFADPHGNPPGDDDYRYAVHQAVAQELGAWSTKFDGLSEGRVKPDSTLADSRRERPDLFEVVDAQGVGVASATDHDAFGPANANVIKDFPSLAVAVQQGHVLQDVWMVKGWPMSVGAVPIKHDGQTVGAVILGYQLSGGEARRDQRLVTTEVAYFVGDRIRESSTLNASAERELSDQFARSKLYELATGPARPVEITLNGDHWQGYVAGFEGKPTEQRAGVFVFTNADRMLREARSVLVMIPIAGGLGFLLSLGLVLLFFRRHMEPYEEIDQGVLEIINGNLDYWFDVPGKGLAHTMSQNLNIMVCGLSGRPLPEDDEAPEGEHWAEERMFIEEIDPSEFHARPINAANAQQPQLAVPGDAHSGMGYPPDILRLVREADETYKRRLFKEYTDALRTRGEPVQGISFEKFIAKLESNATALRTKYQCSRVRFLVVDSDGKVTLKPIPIN